VDDVARGGSWEPGLDKVFAQLGATPFRRLVQPEAAQHHLFGGGERLRRPAFLWRLMVLVCRSGHARCAPHNRDPPDFRCRCAEPQVAPPDTSVALGQASVAKRRGEFGRRRVSPTPVEAEPTSPRRPHTGVLPPAAGSAGAASRSQVPHGAPWTGLGVSADPSMVSAKLTVQSLVERRPGDPTARGRCPCPAQSFATRQLEREEPGESLLSLPYAW
jgi:hypothetical protein